MTSQVNSHVISQKFRGALVLTNQTTAAIFPF